VSVHFVIIFFKRRSMPTTSNPVLKMLKADHKKVQDLFAEYQIL